MLSVVAVAFLLAAEPWVQWRHVMMGSDVWTPAASYHSLEACEAEAVERIRTFRPTPDLRVTEQVGDTVRLRSKDGLDGFVRYVCLPANLDPRK
jgi:hypothetical protein